MGVGKGFSKRIAALRSRLSRVRYFRGHGVHSPFVYGIVREVFMCRTLLAEERELYRVLLAAGVNPRRAVQLQNLATYCRYQTFGLNHAEGDLCVVTPDLSADQLLSMVQEAAAAGTTVVVLSPAKDGERQQICDQIVTSHRSTTVDNRAYLLIFNNHLPKQHFRI